MVTGNPFVENALRYFDLGYEVFSIPLGQKGPPPVGVTGHRGRGWSREQVAAGSGGNIGIRISDGLLGLDVDAYGQKTGGETLQALEAMLGPLPPTVVITSRSDGVSGIRLYRVPLGRAWANQPGIETLWAGHRYAVGPGSLHPEGRTYRCYRSDNWQEIALPAVAELPALPLSWVTRLDKGTVSETAQAAGGQVVTEFLARYCSTSHPDKLDFWASSYRAKVAQGHAHYDSIRAALRGAMTDARKGWIDAAQAEQQLQELYRLTLDTRAYDPAEWQRLVAYAVAQAEAEDMITPLGPVEGGMVPGKDVEPTSWGPVDLGAVLDGNRERLEPTLMPRGDHKALMYAGKVHWFHGESESGKSLICQAECARLLQLGEPVLYVDFEDDAAGVVGRMRMFGASHEQIKAQLTYVRPDEQVEGTAAADWERVLSNRYTLAVVDGVTDALSLLGLSTNSDNEVSRFMAEIPKAIAKRTGAAVAVIDHVAKNPVERGRFALGSQFKMAGVDGAAFTVTPDPTPRRGHVGRIVLRVAKDRPGGVRPHCGMPNTKDRTQEAAVVTVDSFSNPDRPTVIWGAPRPDPGPDEQAVSKDHQMEARICEWLGEQEDGATSRAVRASIKGPNLDKDNALYRLERDGYISITRQGASNVHRLVRKYDRADVPNRAETVPRHTDADRADVPSAYRHGTDGAYPQSNNNEQDGFGTPEAALARLQSQLTEGTDS